MKSGVARFAVLAALVAIVLSGCQPQRAATVEQVPTRQLPISPEALALWKRAVLATRTVPLQARVTITRYAPDIVSVFDYTEGGGGRRYRSHYLAPTWARGRTIVSDGETIWHYEPRSRVIFRRPAPPTLLRTGTDDELGLPAECQPQIESHNALVNGREAEVLVLHSPTGGIIERRWIDKETVRIVRTEEYAGEKSRLMRRVELANLIFHPTVTVATFTPKFPPGTRMLDARVEKVTDERETVAAARRERLPARAHGFALRSVRRGPTLGGSSSPTPAVYLLYSNGAQEVSVFVTHSLTRTGKNVDIKDIKPMSDWKAVSLGGSKQVAFAQEKSQGRSAVLWFAPPHRYIAVAHLALFDLLPVAQALASDNDPDLVHPKNSTK